MRYALLSFLSVIVLCTVSFAADLPTRGTLPSGKTDIFTATPEQIDEALQVTSQCKTSDYSSTYFNCDCLGMKFLELRQKRGDEVSHVFLVTEAQKSCPNATDVAGITYRQCLVWSQTMRPTYYKDFCSCFASEYAQEYQKKTSDSLSVREAQLTQAYMKCDQGRQLNDRLAKESLIERIKKEGLYNVLFPGGN